MSDEQMRKISNDVDVIKRTVNFLAVLAVLALLLGLKATFGG